MSGLLERCPRCSATVVGTAAWCTLCYADLTPPPTPPAPTPPAPLPPARELVRQPDAPVPARAGRHAAPAVDLAAEHVSAPACESAAEPTAGTGSGPSDAELQVMLAALAVEDRARRPPSLRWFENRQLRVAVMIGGTLLVVLLSFSVLVVLGAIFG